MIKPNGDPPVRAAAVCPPCSDGGYGNTVENVDYRCPPCGTVWSQSPEGGAATGPLSNLWQRTKVWATGGPF